MKRTDIALLAIIVIISLTAAYFVGQAVLGQTKQGNATVEVVDAISSAIAEPDKAIFHKDAINPTVPINIGGSNNQQPFNQ